MSQFTREDIKIIGDSLYKICQGKGVNDKFGYVKRRNKIDTAKFNGVHLGIDAGRICGLIRNRYITKYLDILFKFAGKTAFESFIFSGKFGFTVVKCGTFKTKECKNSYYISDFGCKHCNWGKCVRCPVITNLRKGKSCLECKKKACLKANGQICPYCKHDKVTIIGENISCSKCIYTLIFKWCKFMPTDIIKIIIQY